MKKILIFILCLALCGAVIAAISYNNNNDGGLNAPIGAIRTAEADNESTPEEPDENNDDFSDRTEETDRKEIENNLRDARELIENGYIEDATMIIDSLKTRDLTDAERKEILELQKMMIKISD